MASIPPDRPPSNVAKAAQNGRAAAQEFDPRSALQQQPDPQLMQYIVAHQANNSWVESLSRSSFEEPTASAFITSSVAPGAASPSSAVPSSAYDCNFGLPPAAAELLYEPHNVLPSATPNPKNNPYLAPSDFHHLTRSPFRELQRGTQPPSACSNVREPDWVPASQIFQPSPLHDYCSSAAAASRLQQQHPLAFAQPVFQSGQYSANYGLFPGGNMVDARTFHQRSSTFQAGDEQLSSAEHAGFAGEGQWGSYQRSAIGKSQSMRALYEENAALRRALASIRDQGAPPAVLPCAMSPAQQSARYIGSDGAEGRTLSMRERGRWGVPPEAQQLFGEWPAACHCSAAWAVMQASHHHRQQCCWHGRANGRAPDDGVDGGSWGEGVRVRTLKEQMEAAKEAAAKRKEGGEEPAGRRRRCRVRTGGGFAEEEDAGRCAMCGGALFQEPAPPHMAAGYQTQLAGLPLRLCPACHPSAEDVAPCEPGKHAAPSGRHRAAASMAVAISLACKPASASAPKKKSTSRNIVDLCRHLVGLTATVKPTHPSSPPTSS